MRKRSDICARPAGFSLVELVIVLALLGMCAVVGAVAVAPAVQTREAKGAAQGWQAAAAWGQAAVVWHGGDVKLVCADGAMSLEHNATLCGGTLSTSIPPAAPWANVARWRMPAGAVVTFGGSFASPDGGGSLLFGKGGLGYRVAVRPESGLTARSVPEAGS